MKTIAVFVAFMVAALASAEAGIIPHYTGLAHAVEHSGAYYDGHYGAALGFSAPYAAYYGNPTGTYSYWGSHGPTVVQENAAILAHPLAGHAALLAGHAPYSGALYGLYGAGAGPVLKTTVVQANVANELTNHWGYPAVYGPGYGYGYAGYGQHKYLAADTSLAAPIAKYVLH